MEKKQLYKFINENKILRAKNPLYLEKTVISNPTEKTLKENGYMELIKMSSFPLEEGIVTPHYSLKDKTIICTYELTPFSEEVI